ncbi:hypothetical protein [Sporomusa sp. KB1]|jgi:hypothetical protein|uniref:hypothetical protein n=1 Tax=Sporomusa sp. KB1 TaxID=943346 RepID=UPI001C941086|nr:hypothetical protein [Sporomusa sp. KB1]
MQNGPNERNVWGILYRNTSVEVITGNDALPDRLIYIAIKDSSCSTTKGIKVGDNIQRALASCGEPTRINKDQKEGWYFVERVPEVNRKVSRYIYLSQESGKYGRLVFTVDPTNNIILSIAASVLPFGP